MTYHLQQWIAGQSVSSTSESLHDIHDPATGEIVGQVSFASDNEVATAIANAQQSFDGWSNTPPLKRARILFKFKELLEKYTDDIAQHVTREHGKTLEDARGSVMRGIELVEFACGIPNLLKGSYSENVATHIDCYTVRQPLGVCAGISPFNFPVMIPIWMFVPAIACGNTFVLKPSERDPSAPLMLAELLQQAGLPDGVLNVVQGQKHQVDLILNHPDVQAVTCVGSTPVAEYVYQTAIANGKRAHTFGGAKNHCIIMPDADISDAADAVCSAAYGSAGERCMALSVAVAVGDQVADQLVSELQQKIANITIAPGDNAQSDMGPLITAEHLQRVKDYVGEGVNEGATLVVDGRDFKLKDFESGYFMAPCLFDHVTETMRIYQEEIFGPVLVVVRVKDSAEALQLINQHEYGNGTAIFTRNGEVAREFAARVQVGMVGVNVPIPVPVAYHTFGGWKRSIFGDLHLHGGEGVKFYTKQKTVTMRWPKSKNEAFHMPSH